MTSTTEPSTAEARGFTRAPYVWTYPEEAALAGPDRLAAQVAELGFAGVAVTLSYHRARLLFPRYGRVASVPAGHLAFEPDPSRYGAFAPTRTASVETVRAVHELRSACMRRGIAFHAWVVLLHHEGLVDALPEAEAQSVDGTPIGRSLCPSHPAAAEYTAALVEDIAAQLAPDAFEVEAATFPAWEPAYTMTIGHGEPTARAKRLGSQCFCPSCRERFAAAGQDAEQLAAETRAAAGPPFASPGVDPASDLEQRLGRVRAEALGALLGATAERAHAAGATLRTTAFGDARTVALQGISPVALAGVDGVVLGLAEAAGDDLLDRYHALRALTGDASAVVSTNWAPHRSAESLRTDIERLAGAGADGIAVYNLALAPAEALPSFAVAATAAATPASFVPVLRPGSPIAR